MYQAVPDDEAYEPQDPDFDEMEVGIVEDLGAEETVKDVVRSLLNKEGKEVPG